MRQAFFRSFPSRLLRLVLAGTIAGLATLPLGAMAHDAANHAQPAAAAAANSTELTGRLGAIAVVDRTAGITRSYPLLELADGQRYRLENAGAVPTGVEVIVSGRLSGHTLVAENVRGTTAPGPLPKAAAARGELTGTIRVFHIDYADTTSEFGYTLSGDNGRRNVIDFGTPLPGIENGARATISGSVDGRGYISVDTIEILAPPSPVTSRPTLKTDVTASVVTTNYAVAALQFPNNTSAPFTYGSTPFTPASINTNVFGALPTKSAAEYYKEASYGAQLLSGAVTSGAGTTWLQATVARPTTCGSNAQLDAVLATIEGQSKTLAASAATNPVANLDWNSYPGGILYIADSLPCGWAGLGYIGFARAYTNGYQALWVVGHEMGHGFGLYHAGSVDCGANVISPSGCGVTEYGDPYVIMGNVNPGHFNAFQKNVLGYIQGGVANHLSGTTTYTLGPIESPGQSLYAVRIPTNNANRTYWVEFRQGIGFDAGFAGIGTLGAQIRIAYPFENQCSGCSGKYDDTQFLDMTPATSPFTDGALVNGATYTDTTVTPNISIKVTAASASALDVQVSAGGGAGSTTTTLASSANPSTVNQSVTFTASVTGTNPTGNVAFKDAGTTLTGCGSIALAGSGNTRTAACAISTLAAGVHSITADYAGDASNNSSSSSPLSQTVKTATTTALASSQNPSTSGASVTFTATVSGSAPTGNVAFASDGVSIAGCTAVAVTGSGNSRTAACATTALAVGSHAIVASYGGDGGNGTSSSPTLTQAVNSGGPVSTTTTLASSQNPSASGASVTFTATVNGSAPTGNVAFTSDGVTITSCSAIALSGSGNSRTAACATSSLTVGTHAIVATYAGNAGNAGSASSPLSQVVNSGGGGGGPGVTTTTLASSVNPSLLGSPVTLTATVNGSSPTGNVAFTSDGASIAGCNAIALAGSGNSRTAACATGTLTAGTHAIVASYGGDSGNAGSASTPLSQVVNSPSASPTTTTVTSGSNPATAGTPVALTATVVGNPPVTSGAASFTANGAPIIGCAVVPVTALGTATCNATLAAGAYSIVASYSGNASALASSSPIISQVVPFAAIGNTIQFASAAYSVNESTGGIMLTVTRIGDVSNAASVNYATAGGTATSGADFTATSGALAWLANDSSTRTVLVPIVNDGIAESSETFTVALSGAQGAALGAVSAATVTIMDDDGAATSMPGTATVVQHPYGTLSVQGGTLNGNTISNLQKNAVIQLGATVGAPGSFAKIDFQGFAIGAGNTLTIRSGAAGQTVYLANANATTADITGLLLAQGGNGAAAPSLVVQSVAGLNVNSAGSVIAPAGLALDTLGSPNTTGGDIVNQGWIDGGNSLALSAAKANGGGAFLGNALTVATFGNLNNPVNGAHFLANALQLYPSTGGNMSIALAAYGGAPQYINLMAHGNATFTMPSAWPNGSSLPANNRPVLPNEIRAAGVPNPAYGAGSIIVRATSNLTLDGGISQDLVFPGGLVLIAAGAIDLHGTSLDNGWTTSGQPFQGMFLEAASIVDTTAAPAILLRTNNLNWANFSVRPSLPVQTWTLQQQPGGAAQFAPSDASAPHLNFYWTTIEAAAANQCWNCLVNGQVIDFSVVP